MVSRSAARLIEDDHRVMPDARPSMLCVTSEIPWPLDSGGHLRTFHLLRALADEFRIRLVTAVTHGQPADVEAVGTAGIQVRPALVPRRRAVSEAGRAMTAAVHREPYVFYRRHNRPEVGERLQAEVVHERPDVLYLDHLDSFQFASLVPDTPMVLDLHNVYSLLARREAADRTRSWMARRYLAGEARLLEAVETVAVHTADLVFSVSEQEQGYFSGIGGSRVALVQNGVDCTRYASLQTGRPFSASEILFIGTMSWSPNAAAARFLATEVLPAVQARVPRATLTLVGRNPGPDVLALARPGSVDVVANAPDIVPYLRDARVLAVPLEVGGGTRLKILEAFAAGLPVVSTAIGCEGLAGANGRELIVADQSRFADALCSILADPAGGEALAKRARVLARDRYDWPIIGQQARHAIRSMLSDRRGVGRRNPSRSG